MRTSEPKFLLKEPKSTEKTLISLFIRFNNQRLVYSTGLKIHPDSWDFTSQKAKVSRKNPENTEINALLLKIEKAASDILREFRLDNITPTPDKLRNRLTGLLNDKPQSREMSLFLFIEKFLREAQPLKTSNTIKVYQGAFNHLKNFATLRKRTLNFEDIDLEFYSDFCRYMIYELKFSQNTISKYIKTLKVFLNAATEEGYNKNMTFKSKKFSRPSEEVVKIYLKQDEIMRIYGLDLSQNPHLDKVRDLFVIGCYTGLRYSDLIDLKPEHIIDGYIRKKTLKTGEPVVIPIKPVVLEILNKYNYNFPKPVSNQKMNEYLKEIGQLADLSDDVIISKKLEGQQRSDVYKKHELITCHCSRRSFATNCYLEGIPSINIMKITGHRNEKVFMEYIRFTKDENALKLKEHSFFK
ncbi:MAG: site-specific integrase [Bacteroidia bacterium]